MAKSSDMWSEYIEILYKLLSSFLCFRIDSFRLKNMLEMWINNSHHNIKYSSKQTLDMNAFILEFMRQQWGRY